MECTVVHFAWVARLRGFRDWSRCGRGGGAQGIPTRIAVTARAVERRRGMVRDLAHCRDAVVAALTEARNAGMVKARGAP